MRHHYFKKADIVILAAFLIISGYLIADVSTTTTKVTYSCNGSTTAFDFSFPVTTTSDMAVVLRVTSTGVETTLNESTDYSLSATNNDYSNGGTVTTVATYASGNTITLRQAAPLTQDATLQDSGILRVAALESALDRLTLLVQQMQEQLDRALIIPETETLDMALPNSVTRANQHLVFSATGAPTVSSSGFTSDDYTVSSYMEGVLDDTSEGVFKATVNLEIGTDVQAYDAELVALATVTSAANKLPYFTGSGTASVAAFPVFARTYLDDAAGDDVFTTLGLLDEDDLSTDDPCVPASQQSVKAYADAISTASDTYADAAALHIRTGNITTSDFDEGDTPVTTTWTNLDLSSVSSSDATALLLSLRIKDAATDKYLYIRKDGTTSAQPGAVGTVLSQVANLPIFANVIVGCTSGVVEYYLATGVDEFDVTVIGWWE